MKKLLYLFLVLTTASELTAMKKSNAPQKDSLGKLSEETRKFEQTARELNQQQRLEQASQQVAELKQKALELGQKINSSPEQSSSRSYSPTSRNATTASYKTENQDSSEEEEEEESREMQDFAQHNPQVAHQSSEFNRKNEAIKTFKISYVYGKWACYLGFANSCLSLYFGIRNLVSNNENKLIGISACLLGTAGIVASSYGNEQLSKLFKLTSSH